MALLQILERPDGRLHEAAQPVTEYSDEFRKLIEDMAETMYVADGVGLAGPQVGVGLRVFLIDIEDGKDLKVFCNPTFLSAEGEQLSKEGCLSIPGVMVEKKRFRKIRVSACDEYGMPFEIEAEGLMSVAIQHENDHLSGVLMTDPPKNKRELADAMLVGKKNCR